MNRLCGWLSTTMKENETKEIDFLKNESMTMTTFVLVSQSSNPSLVLFTAVFRCRSSCRRYDWSINLASVQDRGMQDFCV